MDSHNNPLNNEETMDGSKDTFLLLSAFGEQRNNEAHKQGQHNACFFFFFFFSRREDLSQQHCVGVVVLSAVLLLLLLFLSFFRHWVLHCRGHYFFRYHSIYGTRRDARSR
uniref:Uncharacterized protein n=1 Tax=Trypanosoma vivax (strain Y486) TaxID=1055687 RepID=G0TU68_TRYVY|nr:hypothetical protein TVY486_0401680 [Trypanosoma vivax Y486]